MTLREKILNTPRRSEPVPVPEWGCSLTVIEMTGREAAGYQAASHQLQEARKADGQSPDGLLSTGLLLARTVRDEAGEPVFADADAAALADASGSAVDRLLAVAIRLNGIGRDAQEAAEKKSPAPPGGSGSGTPASAGTPTPTTC